jgi:2-methylcitrate dehydratase PrpD
MTFHPSCQNKVTPPATSLTAAVAAPADIPMTEIPDDALEIAHHALLDWMTVLLAGWEEPAVSALKQHLLEEGGTNPVKGGHLLGSGERVGRMSAALLNGFAAHILDFDDTHLASRVHASAALWPAIFAVGENEEASGADALAAFVAGVEAAGRAAAIVGEAHYRRGWHNTATLGSFGATVAAARIMKMEQGRLRHALGLAATLTGGLRALFGTPGKPLHAGRAAANGVMAADLARRGFDAVDDIFDRPDGYPAVSGDAFAFSGFAARWETRGLRFKYHSACYGAQAPIEAALRLREQIVDQEDKTGDRILSLEVEIEPQYLTVCDIPQPATSMEARFSVRYLTALALLGEDIREETSLSRHLRDPAVLALCRRTRVVAAREPSRAKAALRVRLDDGSVREQVFDASRAERSLEKQKERLLAKSSRLLAHRFSAARMAALRQLIDDFAACSSVRRWVREWIRLVAPGDASLSHEGAGSA